jgi:voltage-gated sodium channel
MYTGTLSSLPLSLSRWVSTLEASVITATRRHSRRSRLLALQQSCRRLVQRPAVRSLLVLCICANFTCDCAEYSLELTQAQERAFGALQVVFALIFALELLLNAISYWFTRFAYSAWTWLDVLVVAASLVSLTSLLAPQRPHGAHDVRADAARLIRSLRILRLVRSVRVLSNVMKAIIASLLPMLSVAVIVLVVMCIFAVAGVALFSSNPNTNRHFASLGQTMFTLFFVLTFENWVDVAEAAVDNGEPPAIVVVYFVAYICLVGYVLSSVLVAVLLESFASTSHRTDKEEREEGEMLEMRRRGKAMHFSPSLEPLLAALLHLETTTELSDEILVRDNMLTFILCRLGDRLDLCL